VPSILFCSDIYARMVLEKDAEKKLIASETARKEAFFAAVQEDKRKGVSKKSPYTVSFFTQVKALTVRQCAHLTTPGRALVPDALHSSLLSDSSSSCRTGSD
jgi:hypothetical protein